MILVDTGLGTQDLAHPHELSFLFRTIIRPKLSLAETAAAQVKQLGYDIRDVQHIILTHLDLDHAGGLPDFPNAEVHVSGNEYNSAMALKSARDRFRYHPKQWSHNPKWKVHPADGETWNGFEAVRTVDTVETEILMIPLSGHTDGHCGVAVKSGEKWILNCGDAYFYHEEMSSQNPKCTPGLSLFQTLMESDRKARLHNQQRLRELKHRQGQDVEMFCSHDHDELCTCRGHEIGDRGSGST